MSHPMMAESARLNGPDDEGVLGPLLLFVAVVGGVCMTLSNGCPGQGHKLEAPQEQQDGR